MNNKPDFVSGFGALKYRQELRGVVPKKQFTHSYEHIISVENLLEAWREFIQGKRKRADVQEFERHLMRNVLELHHELAADTYQHGGYHHFKISDPKPRDIHKASVRDRLVHHALHRILYPFFDRIFIADSYSCRKEKGTHRAMNCFQAFAHKVSKNDTRTCWALKCDIRKFFASVDQRILIAILRRYISCECTVSLLQNVIESFHSTTLGKGLPLGNLTSQLLVNIYMNEFDQFAKHKLKAKHYIRYADDFVFMSADRGWLGSLIPRIRAYLHDRLVLKLHPDKVSIRTYVSGVDFLGWVHFPDHRVLLTTTKRRMFRRLQNNKEKPEVLHSYLGMLSHGNTQKLQAKAISIVNLPASKQICQDARMGKDIRISITVGTLKIRSHTLSTLALAKSSAWCYSELLTAPPLSSGQGRFVFGRMD